MSGDFGASEASGFLIRPAVPTDFGFIYSNWLRELRNADHSPLPDDLWFPAHRAAIDRVLADHQAVVAVACAPDDPNEILGFAAGRPGEVLHWVHVLKVFRGKGLRLVPALLLAVGATGGVPAAFQHPAGRSLRNPPRPRWARRYFATTTTSGSSRTSTSGSQATQAPVRPPAT